MVGELKAKLRAWLIALVRDAVKAELETFRLGKPLSGTYGALDRGNYEDLSTPTVRGLKPDTIPVKIQPEPSFESMQSEALREQEMFYAPRV